ncbi:hypothetical protein GA0061099_1001970 [Bradyrhizobium yuanmingense]|uniref:Uncharacterized protein n=1 Tax=Bradyrhizobium yuanmingense TaxID=108015 RepID=A0A1C3UD27_9BRAD|nr:hypothetical protein IQ15_06175 [Bradyrhizobium yuanmingense]SCB13383.1 hypothetical protein GA0061099_1001970 [Bradyrhizobium yuanmingense]
MKPSRVRQAISEPSERDADAILEVLVEELITRDHDEAVATLCRIEREIERPKPN